VLPSKRRSAPVWYDGGAEGVTPHRGHKGMVSGECDPCHISYPQASGLPPQPYPHLCTTTVTQPLLTPHKPWSACQ
jgi:hypothetical protein